MNPSGLLALDPEGHVTAAGPRMGEIVGSHYSLLYTAEDRAAGMPESALEAAARNGSHEAEAWRVRSDGSRYRARIRLQSLHDASGRLLGFAEFARPTAHAETLEAFSQLSGGIAHDFNNALHVIKNAIDALSRRTPQDAKTAAIIEMAKRNADHAASLTQLLVHSHHQALDPQPVDANAAIGAMSALLRQTIGDTIELEIIAAPDLWPVATDERQLAAAIVNLAVNAREAMPQGGRLTIRTRNATLDAAQAAAHEVSAGDYVTIELSDTGEGMTPAIAARAFDPFFTTKDGGMGTGVGLSQAYAFVKRSRGYAEIDSALGRGTTVRLCLPRSSRTAARATSAATTAPGKALGGLRVLVIEDEALLRMSIGDMLAELGCSLVGSAASVAEALERVAKVEVDVALLDVNLSGEASYPVASALEARQVPLVFMSGYGELDGRWRGRPHVRKPFALDELMREMQRAVERG